MPYIPIVGDPPVLAYPTSSAILLILRHLSIALDRARLSRKTDPHQIPSGSLGFIEHLVRLRQEHAKLHRIFAVEPGSPKARRNLHALSLKRKGKRRELFPKPVDRCFYLLRLYMRKHHQKLVSAK